MRKKTEHLCKEFESGTSTNRIIQPCFLFVTCLLDIKFKKHFGEFLKHENIKLNISNFDILSKLKQKLKKTKTKTRCQNKHLKQRNAAILREIHFTIPPAEGAIQLFNMLNQVGADENHVTSVRGCL